MTDAIAITGTYADFKLIKTRSAAQIVVEIPIEGAGLLRGEIRTHDARQGAAGRACAFEQFPREQPSLTPPR